MAIPRTSALRHHLRHRTRTGAEQCRQWIPAVHHAQIERGGCHHADSRDDQKRDTQRPRRNSLERVRRHHRTKQNTDQYEAQARHRRRYLHGPPRQCGDRDRQHRARNQAAGKADQIEADAAHGRNERGLRNLQKFAL
jgi:hypothetical protein